MKQHRKLHMSKIEYKFREDELIGLPLNKHLVKGGSQKEYMYLLLRPLKNHQFLIVNQLKLPRSIGSMSTNKIAWKT